jgi:hypothetical protein
MKKLMLTVLFALIGTTVFADIPVTFQCDMGVQVWKGIFNPATDVLVVRGNFQTDAGDPNGDWQGDMFTLSDPDGDTVYTITVNLPTDSAGKAYEYKYVISPDGWESVANRTFTLTAPSMTLDPVFYNDDNSYTVYTNTITFVADLSLILYSGAGNAFDPAQDTIIVDGLNWDGGQNIQGDRVMTQDLINQNIFSTTLTVERTNDSTSWKFHALPGDRFANTGWETGDNRWYVYGPDGSTTTVGPIQPRIFPLYDPISSDVDLIFRVDMHNAVNRYNNEPIPLNDLEFVGIRGGADFLGNWGTGGNWLPSDTSEYMKVLNDDGINGDLTAGDGIWSIDITVPAGTNGGAFEYKYAAMYPGADTVNGGSSPLDNEAGFGQNHLVIINGSVPNIVREDNFGVITSIKHLGDLVPGSFSLEQNYPNPFNPSTTIRYSVPELSHVTVKIYNLLGQVVTTLFSKEQTAGSYEVSFDASSLSSGVYFYSIEAGKYTATKKMMLLK